MLDWLQRHRSPQSDAAVRLTQRLREVVDCPIAGAATWRSRVCNGASSTRTSCASGRASALSWN